MKNVSILTLLAFVMNFSAIGQYNPGPGCVTDANGDCLPNTLLTAMPFLRIVPDARAGAMGDAGIATSVDGGAMHFNASKLVFAEQNQGLSATYTPWLRDLGLQDVYLTYLSGYKKIDDLQAVGASLRFFSLGNINFTDADGNPAGMGSPRELEFSIAYARKLSDKLSAGLTGKYIYSNLASGQVTGGLLISSANAFAADFSLTYKNKINISGNDSDLSFGMSISNVGSKVTYTEGTVKDFLPMNIGIGGALTMNIDEYNAITFALDINKMLTPTPVSSTIIDENGDEIVNPDYDTDGNGFADFREQSMFSALLGSFGDAQGGFSEELQEFAFSVGAEYWYDKQFAVRAGYYYENPLKGDRKFLTVGIGLKYNVFGLNLSYLVPTNNRRNPLDNTLRFTLNFDIAE